MGLRLGEYARRGIKVILSGIFRAFVATLSWFKEQVVAHHLSQTSVRENQESPGQEEGGEDEGKIKPANDKKLDLVEYLYKQRLNR